MELPEWLVLELGRTWLNGLVLGRQLAEAQAQIASLTALLEAQGQEGHREEPRVERLRAYAVEAGVEEIDE